jgi:hypothetical protein
MLKKPAAVKAIKHKPQKKDQGDDPQHPADHGFLQRSRLYYPTFLFQLALFRQPASRSF